MQAFQVRPFQVQLDAYHGPLDLLLYLVKKDEVTIAELPLATLTQQYLDYVAVLERLDPDAVGDFIDVASLLLEIKSRSVLPAADDEVENLVEGEPIESPSDLVQRLLEFKEYRDAATRLESLRLDWSKRYTRAVPPPARSPLAPDERPVEGVELWDLVSAFARVIRDRLAPDEPTTVYNDETPIHVHMQQVDELLRAAREPVPFEDLFPAGPVHKSTLVGVFLAVLELVRRQNAVARQDERYGPITLELGSAPLDLSLFV